MSILCVGEMVADVVVRPVPCIRELPDSVIVDEINIVNGGDALNTAVGLARLGRDVRFVGCAGNDAFGRQIVQLAEEAGVCMSGVRYSETVGNSKVIVLIREDGARNFLHTPGSNQQFCSEDISWEALGQSDHFHIGGTFHLPAFDGEGARQVLRTAQEAGLTTSMDVAYDHSGRWLETIRCCLPYLDYFMPSIGEAEQMLHTAEPRAIAEIFKCLGVKNVIIKMGEAGAYCSPADGKAFTCGCYHVDAVDTTGAGDAFVSGFLAALDRGERIDNCVLYGTANAAFVVQKVGATTGIPSIDELTSFINSTERPVMDNE